LSRERFLSVKRFIMVRKRSKGFGVKLISEQKEISSGGERER
jgi:hypothetical protein